MKNIKRDIAKQMACKFMGIEMPVNWQPDGGISFNPRSLGNTGVTLTATGTNLFSIDQATDLFEQIIPDHIVLELQTARDQRGTLSNPDSGDYNQ